MSGKNTSTNNKEKHRNLAALALIFDHQGHILLSKRDEPTSPLHSLWHFPGGGIEFGESPEETVVREVKEEVGLEIELLTQHPLVYYHQFTKDHEVILFVYPAKYISGIIDTRHDPDTIEAKWFNPKEINFTQTTKLTQEALLETTKFLIPTS